MKEILFMEGFKNVEMLSQHAAEETFTKSRERQVRNRPAHTSPARGTP